MADKTCYLNVIPPSLNDLDGKYVLEIRGIYFKNNEKIMSVTNGYAGLQFHDEIKKTTNYDLRPDLMETLGMHVKTKTSKFLRDLRRKTCGKWRTTICQKIYVINLHVEDFVKTPSLIIENPSAENKDLKKKLCDANGKLYEKLRTELSERSVKHKPYDEVQSRQKDRQLDKIR